MARQYEMSWIPKQQRWMKMHRGRRYAVSCRQLGTAPTKEASWRAANAWWTKKLAELEVGRVEEPHPFTETIALLSKKRDWAVRNGDMELAKELSIKIEEAERLTEADDEPIEWPSENIRIAELFGINIPSDLDPEVAQHFFGDRRIWQERFALDKGKQTPLDRTIGAQVDRWVQTQRALAEAGKITPDRADNNRICLYHFRDFMIAATPIENIDAARFHDYFLHCLAKVKDRGQDKDKKKGWSAEYATKVFGVARSFVRFLWEAGLIDLPRNIDSRQHRFGAGAKKVPTLTVEEFKTLVGHATGQLKLHLLLMANCGMLQTDISDLRQDEVDWVEGRIIRKRSKTDDKDDVPTVNYKLWPLTFELLKKYRSDDPEIALLTEAGNRWVSKELIEGRLRKADNIASCYVWLKKKTGTKKPLKLIRKTSATIIEGHVEFGRYKSHFLGHSPRTIADRNYAAPNMTLFDKIVEWLGQQYGF
jgi:integrase